MSGSAAGVRPTHPSVCGRQGTPPGVALLTGPGSDCRRGLVVLVPWASSPPSRSPLRAPEEGGERSGRPGARCPEVSPLLCLAISRTPGKRPGRSALHGLPGPAAGTAPAGPPCRPSAPQGGSATWCSSPRRRVAPWATHVPSAGLHTSVCALSTEHPHTPQRWFVGNQKGSDKKAQQRALKGPHL